MFIVIEGLDGSGKSTQLSLLQEYLRAQDTAFEYLHFPRLDTPLWGDMIARFLRGEFGDNHSVNPYLVALIYACDRNDAKTMISQWLKDGKLVILDRYVNSNIAYQCAKLPSKEEKTKLMNWILHLEYEYNKLPAPALNLFLDVPFRFTEQKLTSQRQGDDRNYLHGVKDIHEDDLNFQRNVREAYLMFAQNDTRCRIVNCSDGKDNMLAPHDIFEKILSILKTEKIVKP